MWLQNISSSIAQVQLETHFLKYRAKRVFWSDNRFPVNLVNLINDGLILAWRTVWMLRFLIDENYLSWFWYWKEAIFLSWLNEWVARNRIIVYTQRVLGLPRNKDCKSLQENVWRKLVSTSKKRFWREINAFFEAVLSEIDLGDVNTWQV